ASPGLARENHSAVAWDNRDTTHIWVFAGRSGSNLYRDLMQISYSRNNAELEDVWDTTLISTTGAGAQQNDYPRPRERHTAILSTSNPPYMIIFGGVDANGAPLSDLRKLP